MTIQVQHSIAYELTSGTLVIKGPPPLAERTRHAYRELWRLWRTAQGMTVGGKWTYGVVDGLSVMVSTANDGPALSARYGGGYHHWYGWRDCVRGLAWLLGSTDPLIHRAPLALPTVSPWRLPSGKPADRWTGTPTQATVLGRDAL